MYSVEVNELQQTKISRTFPLGKALFAIAGAYYSKGEDITLNVILAITLELDVQCRPLSLVAWWLPQSDFPPSTRAPILFYCKGHSLQAGGPSVKQENIGKPPWEDRCFLEQ